MRRISFDTYDNYETSYSPELLITTFIGINPNYLKELHICGKKVC